MKKRYSFTVAAVALLASSSSFAQTVDLQSLQRQINALQAKLEADDAQLKQGKDQINQLTQQLQAMQAKQDAAPAPVVVSATPAPAATGGLGAGLFTLSDHVVYPQNKIGPFAVPGSDVFTPGTFHGAFQVTPDTMLKVGGRAELDTAYDFNSGLGAPGAQSYGIKPATLTTGSNAGLALPGTAAARQEGRFVELARNTRIDIELHTKTEGGEVKFFLETDFQGGNTTGNSSGSNSTEPRLRLAYGSYNGFTLGQAWTLWEDRATIPSSVDINTAIGQQNGLRTIVAQYQYDFDKEQRNTLAIGIEDPFNDNYSTFSDKEAYITAGLNDPTNNVTKLPDITFKYAHNAEWGRVTFAGVGRYLEANTAGIAVATNSGVTEAVHASTLGWGFTTGAKVLTGIGEDNMQIRLTGGNGIGRYLQGISPPSALVDAHGKLHDQGEAGMDIGYQHWFAHNVASNLIFGIEKVFYDNDLISAANRVALQNKIYEGEINVFWYVNPYVAIAPAYIFANTSVEAPYTGLSAASGATRSVSGTTAHDNRLQFTTMVGF